MEDGNMLIVGREIGQPVLIDDVIKSTVLQFGFKLRLVIDAPIDRSVFRRELYR
jgi:sRNA-binding carbon storage regulator CsrA